MAEEKKVPYIVVNYKAKTFTINDAVKASEQDKEDIVTYLQAGFKMRHKSAKRTEQAKNKAVSDKEIKEALKNNKEALVKYEEIKKNKEKDAQGKRMGGFFKAKKWFAENCKEAKKEEK